MEIKKIILIAMALFATVLCSSKSAKELKEGEYSKKQLLEDFDQLTEVFKFSHPKSFTDMNHFEKVIKEQRRKVNNMTEYDFFRVLAPVIGSMRCGHAYIYYSNKQYGDTYANGSFLPLNIKVIGDDIYVMDDFSGVGIEKGSQIHSINGKPSSEVLDIIYASLTADGVNSSSKEAALNNTFGSYSSFENVYYYFVESPEKFNIEYSLYGSQDIISESLPPGPCKMEMFTDDYFYEFNDNYAKLKITHFNTYKKEELEDFTDYISNFFDQVKERNITNVVLDLRGNGGGDPYAGNFLLTYLLKSPFQYFRKATHSYDDLEKDSQIADNSFKGDLYTLVDGLGFSTTGHVLSHIADQRRATIIGQESGGSFMCNDWSKKITLKNTKINFNMPQMQFATSVKSLEAGKGIKPDISIEYNVEDYINSNDPEMEKVLELIKS